MKSSFLIVFVQMMENLLFISLCKTIIALDHYGCFKVLKDEGNQTESRMRIVSYAI